MKRDTDSLRRRAWSLGEISKITGLSIGYLRNEVRAKRLSIRKFGRRVLVIETDLQDFLEFGSPGNGDTETPMSTNGKRNVRYLTTSDASAAKI